MPERDDAVTPPARDLQDLLKQIRLLLLDVDGVLTDGAIIYTDTGQEIKGFHSRDGLGIKLAMEAGLRVGIVTGRRGPALMHRCRNLGIDLIFDGIEDKAAALEHISAQVDIPKGQIAFVGDDLPDLPIMRRVAVAVAVADACPEVREAAHMVTSAPGGAGAVREVCQALLQARGVWEAILKRFSC
jgi:3-deoxy-D-manno-octulosonate 8-phosphate phosphatase (KDO 8-P phosphatase)